jgi:hypothetical protein
LSAVADIDAKFLAVRLIHREPAMRARERAQSSAHHGRSPLLRDSYCVISDSACRNVPRIVENGRNMSQERLKHHGSPNGGRISGLPEPVSQASDVVAAFVGSFSGLVLL